MCPVPLPPTPQSRGWGQPSPARGANRPQSLPYDNDDDSTVYSDVESYDSDSSTVLVPFPVGHRQEKAPRFRLNENEGSKQVYEAWNLYFFPARQVIVCGTKVLGINIQEYNRSESRVSVSARPSEQSELANEHYRAVREYQVKNRRGWAGKLLLGNGMAYDDDLNQRCEKLPGHVKHALTTLLLDRGRATSTRFRTRTWAVVSMREQFFCKFAGKDFAEAKNQSTKKSPDTQMVYSFIIQGSETKVSTTADGLSTTDPWSNPWTNSDLKEILNKSLERSRRRADKRAKKFDFDFDSPPSYRSSSPPRSRRSRFVAPPSYETRPHRARARSVSPEPVRFRVQRRNRSQDSISDYRPSPFDENQDFYAAPTPPESYTPPPGVSAFSLPPTMADSIGEIDDYKYPPFAQAPSRVMSFRPPPPPRPPFRTEGATGEDDKFAARRVFGGPRVMPQRGDFPPPPREASNDPTTKALYDGLQFLDRGALYPPCPPGTCEACKNTRKCRHYNTHLPYCSRTVMPTSNGGIAHPDCSSCDRERRRIPRIMPAPEYYTRGPPNQGGEVPVFTPDTPSGPDSRWVVIDDDWMDTDRDFDSQAHTGFPAGGDWGQLPGPMMHRGPRGDYFPPPFPAELPPASSQFTPSSSALASAPPPPPPGWRRPTVDDPINEVDYDNRSVSDSATDTS